jgi:hypothetical protein
LCLQDECVGVRLDMYNGPTRGPSPKTSNRPTIWLIASKEGVGLRNRWSENKSTSIEKLVRPALDEAEQHLKLLKQAATDRACRQRQAERATARRRKDDSADAEAIRLRQQLTTMTNRWNEAERIRSFLNVLRDRHAAGVFRPQDPLAFERWLAWADSYANCVDPLVNGRPDDPGRIQIERSSLAALELTARTRAVLSALKIENSDELEALSGAELRSGCGQGYNEVWREITDVLGGLGYNTSRRPDYLW